MKHPVIGICKLCHLETTLRDSHIIPKAFFKKVKSGTPQLARIDTTPNEPVRTDNADWSEYLLCDSCEKFLERNFEGSQIIRLRAYRENIKSPDRLTIVHFEYHRFYLFWLSIIWRASISTMPEFEPVKLDPQIEEACRILIKGRMNNFALDSFAENFKIGILRIADEGTGFDSRKFLTSLRRSSDQYADRYYLGVEGFLVVYQISSAPGLELPEGFSRLKRTSNFRIKKIYPHMNREIATLFVDMLNKAP